MNIRLLQRLRYASTLDHENIITAAGTRAMDVLNVYDESSVESLQVQFNMLNLNNTDSQIQLAPSGQLRITHDWVSDTTETPMEIDEPNETTETPMDVDEDQIQRYSLKIMIRVTYIPTRRRAARIIRRTKRHFQR